ncbi:MAG: SAM-dependent methyltransferase [Enterobacterales bacterium]|jgi:SAM-dependent methyltransferase
MSEKDYYLRQTCRMCLSQDLKKVMALTPTPPGNNFVTKECLELEQPCYPLELHFCEHCSHVQLGHVVDPEILYQNDYSYVSSTSSHFVNHLRDYADHMISKYSLQKNEFVIDIGSNDGTCLSFFQKQGMQVLGVDPATNIAEIANENGVETIADFFCLQTAENIKTTHGKAKLITSHNACAHIDDLSGVIQGVKNLLDDDGIFCLEVGYLYDVYGNNWFDTIYHEHVDFHLVKPFSYLFSRFDMEVISVERISPQGGSIRVVAQHKGGPYEKDTSEKELMQLEQDVGLYTASTYMNFAEKINRVKQDLRELINKLKAEGKTIAAFGAPTKATTLMAHFELSQNDIDYIVDENPLKQGLYSPGLHIPVFSANKIYTDKPDYVLILAWNFAEPIMKNHAEYLLQGGNFIVPMPQPKIVN